jgi:hypothetical protein
MTSAVRTAAICGHSGVHWCHYGERPHHALFGFSERGRFVHGFI